MSYVLQRSKDDTWQVVVGALCLVFTFSWAAYNIRQHWDDFKVPGIQKYMVRLLLIPSLYCSTSFLSLIFSLSLPTTIALQGLGLAILMYNYMELMIGYFHPLGDRESQVKRAGELLELLPEQHPFPPLCIPFYCFQKFQPNEDFLRYRVLRPTFIFQFVVAIISILGVYLSPYSFWKFGVNDGGPFFWLNITQLGFLIWAISGVLPAEAFFAATLKGDFGKAQLAHLLFNPIVALQDVIVPAAVANPMDWFSVRDIIICIEMAVFSAIFVWAFGYAQYAEHKADNYCNIENTYHKSKKEIRESLGNGADEGAEMVKTETDQA